jgi:hypothetical protein
MQSIGAPKQINNELVLQLCKGFKEGREGYTH